MQSKALETLLIVAVVCALAYGGSMIVETVTEKKRLDGLLPHVREKVVILRNRLAERGLKTLVGQTKRTPDEQLINVQNGASDTLDSWHLLGRAIDLYVYRTGQKWDTGSVADYKIMHDEAAKLGFTGIAFNSDGTKKYLKSGKWDGGHLQYMDKMTFAQAKKAQMVA
jgi:hypothetical protein